MSDPAVLERFGALFGGPQANRNLGKLAQANAVADAEGCRGGRDHLFLYLVIEESKVVDISFECSTCDPAMLVTAHLLCDLVRGRSISEAAQLTREDLAQAFGAQSEDIAQHSEPALRVLARALDTYSLHTTPRPDAR